MISQLQRLDVKTTQNGVSPPEAWQTEIGQLLSTFGLQEQDQALFAHNLGLWLRALEQSAQDFRQQVLSDVQRQVQSQLAQVQKQVDVSQQDAEQAHNQLVEDLLTELLASRQQVQTLADRIAVMEVAATKKAPEKLKPTRKTRTRTAPGTAKTTGGGTNKKPQCPVCRCETHRNGKTRTGKQRYLCTGCKFGFC